MMPWRELGCDEALYRRLLETPGRPIASYRQQRMNAADRGIEWRFTLATWWAVWDESGKWGLRGVHRGQYVMARVGDLGPYSPANVRIAPTEENSIEGFAMRRYERSPGRSSRVDGAARAEFCRAPMDPLDILMAQEAGDAL